MRDMVLCYTLYATCTWLFAGTLSTCAFVINQLKTISNEKSSLLKPLVSTKCHLRSL